MIRIEVKSYTFSLQEQYETIYLTLQEMFKAQTSIQNTTEFLQKLQASKRDTPANDYLIRKEFQVFAYGCKRSFRMLKYHVLEGKTQMEVYLLKICINQLFENGNNVICMNWLY